MDIEPINLLNGFIILKYAENTGAFMGFGANWNIYIKYSIFIIIPIIVTVIALIYLMIKEQKMYRLITFSCIIGGAIGNLTDRLFNDFKIIDFLNIGIGNIRTRTFNLADISMLFGMVIYIILSIVIEKNKNINKQDA